MATETPPSNKSKALILAALLLAGGASWYLLSPPGAPIVGTVTLDTVGPCEIVTTVTMTSVPTRYDVDEPRLYVPAAQNSNTVKVLQDEKVLNLVWHTTNGTVQQSSDLVNWVDTKIKRTGTNWIFMQERPDQPKMFYRLRIDP